MNKAGIWHLEMRDLPKEPSFPEICNIRKAKEGPQE
jgi:hypothetical protein